jgi:ribosomal-protein-alanine acetyltransferase
MIRKMIETDLTQVVDLENICFPKGGWNIEQFRYELLENPFSNLLVFEENQMIIGYIDWWITYEQAQLANIAVCPTNRKQGVGQQLLNKALQKAIEEECENMTLEVRVSNERAIQFYEKNGFITVNTRKNYYEDGENAYLMIKPLGGL